MNLTYRYDTEVSLPSFEDDDADVDTVRMPENPQRDSLLAVAANANSTHSRLLRVVLWANAVQSRLLRIQTGFAVRVHECVPELRKHLRDTAYWLSYVRAQSRRYGMVRAPWIAAAVMTFSLAAVAILDATPRAGSPERPSNAVAAAVEPSAPQTGHRTPALVEPAVVPVQSLPLVEPSAGSRRISGLRGSELTLHARSSSTAQRSPGQGTTKRPFDMQSANNALDVAASNTWRCTRNQMAGTVFVSFEPSGVVRNVTLGTLAGDIIQTSCVIRAFQNVRIAPFAGRMVYVRKTFAISR